MSETGSLFFVLLFRRPLIFCFTSATRFIFPTPLSCPIVLCSVQSFTLPLTLPDITSHPVLHDLLWSFRIERSLLSSRVPLWDLLQVLDLLRGPPFNPLSLCTLWDLTRKVPLPCCLGHCSSGRGITGGLFVRVFFRGQCFPLLSPGVSGEDRVGFQPSSSLFCCAFFLCMTLSASFLTSCSFVLSGQCVRICLELLPFPLSHALFLFLLVLLLALSLKMP